MDDGDEYELEGDGITLGSEGLAAAPASGTSGPDGDFIGLPITLGASQPWSIAGRTEGGIGENGVFVEGSVTGSNKNLAVDIEHGAALYLANSTEVGSLTFAGADAGEAGVLNGFVGLLGAQVNSSAGNGVALSHVLMLGSGSVGALTTSDAELGVGSGYPTGEIQARSVTLDAGSETEFEITGSGTTAGVDYGQLSSGGAVALGGASLSVFVGPTSGTKCPTPEPGRSTRWSPRAGRSRVRSPTLPKESQSRLFTPKVAPRIHPRICVSLITRAAGRRPSPRRSQEDLVVMKSHRGSLKQEH